MRAARGTRRLRIAMATVASAALLAACSTSSGSPTPLSPAGGVAAAKALSVDERMPIAPRAQASWLRAVDRAYARAAHGRGAEEWLRQRMAHRRPGERLAVVMGVDDVMVRTHFGGIDVLVPRSVRFARTAHALGYAVFYVTGRSEASGLSRVEATLRRSNVPATAFYGGHAGAADLEMAKARARASIERQGYTLAMSVAASEASFDGSPSAEQEVRLPDFGELAG